MHSTGRMMMRPYYLPAAKPIPFIPFTFQTTTTLPIFDP